MPAKVNVLRCDRYDVELIKSLLNGFISGINPAGKNILIKPNMLQAHKPEENVTTHPAVIQAVAELIIDHGGKCGIGDSPSGWGKENAFNAARKTGIFEVAEKLGIQFDFFDGQEMREVIVNDYKIISKVFLPESYFTYDKVINLPKLKTHSLTAFTLGVKNMLGVIPGNIKADYHKQAPHPRRFASALADLYSVVRPDLTILDAVEGMQGEGPVTGTAVKLNRLFVSCDANALDTVAVKMCGAKPSRIYLINEVHERGLGEMKSIEIIRNYEGNDNEFSGFKKPLIYYLGRGIPACLPDLFSVFLDHYPEADMELCSGCGKCMKICPAEAIDFSRKYPKIDKKKCIRCFCCAEICPEKAMKEKKKLLAKVFS